MLTYIAIFELLPHIIENKNKKQSIIGILVGIILMFASPIISLLTCFIKNRYMICSVKSVVREENEN